MLVGIGGFVGVDPCNGNFSSSSESDIVPKCKNGGAIPPDPFPFSSIAILVSRSNILLSSCFASFSFSFFFLSFFLFL